MTKLMNRERAALCSAACALVLLVGMAYANCAWAAVEPGVYTAAVTPTYASPDDGSIADAGGQSNATLGQSMVEGVVQPQALIENDGAAETVTVRFGQSDMIGNVRVSADIAHDGSFGAEEACELAAQDADAKTADYRFAAEDDSATFKFSVYVEPMGRDVTFFAVLSDPVAGNSSGFAQTVTEGQIAANLASQEDAAAADGTADEVEEPPATTAPASAAADQGLNMPLIIGLVMAAVVIIVLVAYFAAIRPGKVASRKAAEEAARRERLKRS